MKQESRDLTTTLFVLPPDSKFLPVSELSARLQAKIGPVDEGQSVITRPGFRITTRLVTKPLADLINEFREPSLLTDAVLRLSRAHDQDPLATLDLAFDALATLVEARILVPLGSPDAQAPVPSLGAGQAFGGLEIEALVRSLEDTEVYRVRQPDGGPAALKVARDDRQGVGDMLANEARMLDLLAGTDSPKLLGHRVEQGRACVVLEWCEGVSIAIAAQQARASRDRRRLHRIVSNMLEAYGRLHARGVLHGDIHPGNCLVCDDGRVVILDFGSARLIEDGGDALDPARTGIPHFYDPIMAAALVEGRIPPAATPKSEQFAISVLAYMLLTGLHPIESPAVQEELLRRIIDRSPLPFAARGVAAWPAVEAVIMRGMAKQPGERFSDVAGLARAFGLAARTPNRRRRWSDPTERQFDGAIAEVRDLQPSKEAPLHRAWFALRAALAMDDAELLAAADVLVGRAGRGWAAQSVAASIARARSDSASERKAVEGFLAAAEPLVDGPEALGAILAAAEVLDGGALRSADAASLAGWASRRLDGLVSQSSVGTPSSVSEPLLVFAALSLGKSGNVPFAAGLPTRLEGLGKVQEGGVWLWALAHDVFAQPHFKSLALAAKRPRDPLAHGFALLRLHQLTGDMSWVAKARRLAAKEPGDRFSERQIALLMIELKAPERAILPPFALRAAIGRCSR